ncbi:MAG: transglycosylase SLT domain-containing protein [Betaproteobacteria bacterium]
MVPSQPLTLHHRIVVASLACLVAANAGAAIWGYVDEQGQTHVATEKLDERYQLLYKGPSTADLAEGVPAPYGDADLDLWKRTPHVQRLLTDPRVAGYDKLIAQHAKAQGVDPALIKAIVAVESAFIADAVSNKGALGLMQVIPQTAMRYGVAADAKRSVEQKLLDPRINVGIGARYLRDLLSMFGGDVSLALAAYNAGEQAVERYERRIPPYPETQEFVKLVQQFYALYLPPKPSVVKPPVRIMVPSTSAR